MSAMLADDPTGAMAQGVFEYEAWDAILHAVGGGTAEIDHILIPTKGTRPAS